ncbi:MAG: cation transporter [Rhodospirillaceae bacterium]|nr:cation transporter [Rhodospirillaceae bacterium]
MTGWDQLSLSTALILFGMAVIAILVAGTRLTVIADRLAQRTGLGGALFGSVFLGGTTSLPGIVTTFTAASDGHADLAIANAIGGIAAQTAFLGLADIAYRRANLEHAAASAANLTQGVLLGLLLVIPLVALGSPTTALFAIHPASIVLPIAYCLGLRLISHAVDMPMWRPEMTPETEVENDGPGDPEAPGLTRLWVEFALIALTVAVAGFVLTKGAEIVMAHTGMSETAVGGILTAVSTSLPELVTVMVAVRRGALGLAVGDILGGNCFDILMLAIADIAYRDGPIYAAWTEHHTFIVAISLFMTNILLLGLLRREKHGFANIGFESALILATYAGAVVYLMAG